MITYDFTIFLNKKEIEQIINLLKTPASESHTLHKAPLYSYTQRYKRYKRKWFTTELTMEVITTDNAPYPYVVMKSTIIEPVKTPMQKSMANFALFGDKNNRKIMLTGIFKNEAGVFDDNETEFCINICQPLAENVPENAIVTMANGQDFVSKTLKNRMYFIKYIQDPTIIDVANNYNGIEPIFNHELTITKITDQWKNTLWTNPKNKGQTVTIIKTKHGSIKTHNSVTHICSKIIRLKESHDEIEINEGQYNIKPEDIIAVYTATNDE